MEWLASGCCAVDSKCEVRGLLHRLRDNDSIQTIRELIAVSKLANRHQDSRKIATGVLEFVDPLSRAARCSDGQIRSASI